MQYNFPMTLDRQFKNKLEELHDKYGSKMMEIEGMSPKQLDTCNFFKSFMETSTVADATIDDNANVTNRNINTMLSEASKPFTKLLSRNKIYIEMKEEFGVDVANEFLESVVSGEIYEHDSHSSSYMPYCFAFSLKNIVNKGLYFLDEMKAGRPKHWDTFNHHVLEFIAYATNMQAGAVGIPDYLIYAYYFYKKDTENMKKTEAVKYREQKFQEFVYNLNQPYLKGGVQSAYTNVSILDMDHIAKFFKDEIYPDGTDVLYHLNGILDFQKDFLDYIGRLRKERWHTFPVISASLLFTDGKYMDEETAKMVVRHNWEYRFNDVNIMTVEEVTSLASCCFTGEQKIITKSSIGGVEYQTFRELYEKPYRGHKENLTVLHNGSWCGAKIIKTQSDDFYEIITTNNKKITVTKDHINPTLRGNISTFNLTTDDYLLFNTMELNTYPEKDLKLTYNQGILIGAYLGDGSIRFNEKYNSAQVNFSLNEKKYNILLPILKKAIKEIGIKSNINLSTPYNNVYPVSVNSIELANFIKEWTNGEYGHEKELNLHCLTQSKDFRRGILEGYYITDGGNSNRIYTTSPMMAEHLEILITSLGKQSIIDISDRTNETVFIRNEKFKRNYPLYCVRWYDFKNKRSMKNIYRIINNSIYFKVKEIKKIENNSNDVYCFEMNKQDEPYFTLPNGIITHNCRLVSNKEEINKNKVFNSIGGSDLNVGSSKVVTHGLVRLALLSKNVDDFLRLVKEKTQLIHKYHFAHRKILTKLINKGLLPLYTHGMMSLDDQFATVGINGEYEAIKILGGISIDENGSYYNEKGFELAEKMFKTIIEENETTMEKYGFLSNIEQIPGESASIKLNKKDRLYFGNRLINEKLGIDCDIYGNQWIPLKENTSIFHRINAAKLDEYCGGGAILHISLGENFNTFEDAWEFTVGLAKKGVKYFSYISLIDICEEEHSFFGGVCPICGGKSITKGIKIVGYLVKQDSYKAERKKELGERIFYNLN